MVDMIMPFMLNLFFFTFIFLMTKILYITKMIVNYQIGLITVGKLLMYSAPYFIVFVIPMAVMMAVLLTFLRMSGDNEVIALKACGVGIPRFIAPVMAFSIMGALLTAFMSIYGVPWGTTSLKELTIQVAMSNLDAGLKERSFNDKFKDVTLYVNRIDLKKRELIDIFIEDQRTGSKSSTIIAPRGKLFSKPDSSIFHLRLYNGTLHQVNIKDKTEHSISFDTYDVKLDLKEALQNLKEGLKEKDEKELSIPELKSYLIEHEDSKDDQYYQTLLELHRKFSIPTACIVLGFLALPLGIQSKRATRSFGLGLGLVFFLLYYIMMALGSVLGETGDYPPYIGMWLPNVMMGVAGMFFYVMSVKDKTVSLNMGRFKPKNVFGIPKGKNKTGSQAKIRKPKEKHHK